MKKILKIILLNMLLIISILAVLELIACGVNYKIYTSSSTIKLDSVFSSDYFQTVSFDSLYQKIKNIESEMRKPAGLQYKKRSIIIFGCSFALGDRLENEQTFSYKLSKITKRPVYNFSACSWSFSQMLYQLRNPDFYPQIKSKPEYIIYIYMDQHVQRLFMPTYTFPFNNYRFVQYKEVKGHLQEIKHSFPFLTKSNLFYRYYVNNSYEKAHDRKYLNENSHLIKLYFDSSREEAEKHWGKIKFIIIKYRNQSPEEDIYFDADVWKELQKEGFIVIDTKDVVGRIFNEKKDFADDNFHPSESVWDEFTPKFADKFIY